MMNRKRNKRYRFRHRRIIPLGNWTPVTLADSITVSTSGPPLSGVLDLTPRVPVVLSSGSVSLAGSIFEGENWAAPPSWRPPANSSGDGSCNEAEQIPRFLSLAQILALVLQHPLSLCMSGDGPLSWLGTLLDFQKDGICVLIERLSVLLADDMGLGKTIQAAAAMRLLVRLGEIERILVVAPAAVLRNWRDEIKRWAPELRVIEVTGTQSQRAWKWDARVHVKIVSYETLRSDIRRVINRHGSWDLV